MSSQSIVDSGVGEHVCTMHTSVLVYVPMILYVEARAGFWVSYSTFFTALRQALSHHG